jgi:hypothetical protein
MSHIALFPIKMLGLAATGLALAVGWKVGSHLVEIVFDKQARDRFFEWGDSECRDAKGPLWKRQYSKVSGD